ncbi:MAG TPA: protein kinase [Chloroflexia bacterium]|nr:protein kinase [Chloroflexia bacterium]
MVIHFEVGSELLNKYRIEQPIGRGGFGAVYKAVDLLLKRPVAIKVLIHGQTTFDKHYGEGSFEEYLDRFRREAEISSYFTGNPNVITVYSLERDEDQNYYLVLEYLDGGSLNELIKSHGPLPLEQVCNITLDLCHALADIHNHPADIVHRDIKPNNVLLRSNGKAVLADFGVAQIGSESHRTVLKDQRHPGSPPYKSPEQRNSYDYLTPASDLYGLGLIVYEMLTAKMYAKQRILPPSQLNPAVPEWLDNLVIKLLQNEVDHRYRQAEEVSAEIKENIKSIEKNNGLPKAQHANQGKTGESGKPEQQGVIKSARNDDLTTKRGQALLPVQQSLESLLAQFELNRAGTDLDHQIQLGEQIFSLQHRKPEFISELAELYGKRCQLRVSRGENEQAISDISRALELASDQAVYYWLRSRLYSQKGDNERALQDIERSIRLDSEKLDYFFWRGRYYLNAGNYESAISNFDHVIKSDPQVAENYYWRAMCYYAWKDYHKAIADLGRALQRDPANPEYFYQRGLSYFARGSYFYNNEDLVASKNDFETAVRLVPDKVQYLYYLALVLIKTKSFDKALDTINYALELEPGRADLYYWRGYVYKIKNNPRAALTAFQVSADLGNTQAKTELANLQQSSRKKVSRP